MEIQKFTDALSVLLEVEQPWVLTKIDIQPKNKVIDVFIDFRIVRVNFCTCKAISENLNNLKSKPCFVFVLAS